jgi:hypothetical protein
MQRQQIFANDTSASNILTKLHNFSSKLRKD